MWAARNEFRENLAEMRHDEGLLFGSAGLKDEARKSEVRIRLSHWDKGGLRQQRADPDLVYLGYGPLNSRGQSKPAIDANQEASLSIAVPTDVADDIQAACTLIDAYGAVGGRSRNGWGSLCLEPQQGPPEHRPDLGPWSRHWRQALGLGWPHAIGSDEAGLLVWQTARTYTKWDSALRDLSN